MKTQEKILEHKNKVAGVYFPTEVFGEEGLRYVQTEYRLEGGKPDLILLDGDGRYLVVEIKTGRLASAAWNRLSTQIQTYESHVVRDYGASVAKTKFRFACLSDAPLDERFQADIEATGVEVFSIPPKLVDAEPENKVVQNRASLKMLASLRPPLLYSLKSAFFAWGTPPSTQDLYYEAVRVLEDVLPECHPELEIKVKGTDLIPSTKRINVVCPFFSWKRFGQIDLQKKGLNFKMKFDAIDNIFSNARLSSAQLRDCDRFFETVNWNMPPKSRWSHQHRIQDAGDLKSLKKGLKSVRPHIDGVLQEKGLP